MSVQSEINLRRDLIEVAMGRQPADLVVRNGRWVCVQTGEILPHIDVAIKAGRIAYVGPDGAYTIGEQSRVIDAQDQYLVPGLLDAHMHVESGMLTVTEFVRAVIPHGTTGMFIDPHEIANIFGMAGVRLMVDEAAKQPIHVWVQMPSCVPSAPGLETPGATLGPQEVAQAMQWEGIIGLGEVMNFPGVFNADEKMLAEMAETRQAQKVIGGHYASPDLGRAFYGYAAGGAEDDHEGTSLEDAVARARAGMKVMLRQGSAWQDVASQVGAITKLGMDPRHFLLCTDDSHSETLVNEGHVDRAVRVAIAQGVPALTAIQMATLNTAEHFGVAQLVGQIAPGRFGDLLLMRDLTSVQPELVIAQGKVLAEQGRMLVDLPAYPYPDWAIHSVHLGKEMRASDFRLSAPGEGLVLAHVIGIVENQAPNRHLRFEVPVIQGEILPDRTRDLAKIALIERHQGTGRIQVGLVHGFGFDLPCAVATTVAHDSHQMIVVGTSEADMAVAANALSQMDGGQLVVMQGDVIGQVSLPIAGLMSNQRAENVAQQAATVLEGFRRCGCKLNNPNMQLSL
ncbi:MAG: amidohydrolase family protein, partial [Anaerolineales bacterium]|nr:amidohydrolase family protein [Anaerolineales bacterium]